jgi:hypothetical protein
VWAVLGAGLTASPVWAAADAQGILKDGLMGAAVGAISSGASGGKAGKGALIGAGTNVIGSALLGFLSGPSNTQTSSAPSYYAPAPQPVYVQQAPAYVSSYAAPEPVYAPAPVYNYSAPAAPAADSNTKILRQGLLGAGVGAISAEASGGKAGTGALVGAGTTVIGGALLDTLFAPQQAAAPSYSYASAPSYRAQSAPAPGTVKHVLRKFDASGKVISEEEFWQ